MIKENLPFPEFAAWFHGYTMRWNPPAHADGRFLQKNHRKLYHSQAWSGFMNTDNKAAVGFSEIFTENSTAVLYCLENMRSWDCIYFANRSECVPVRNAASHQKEVPLHSWFSEKNIDSVRNSDTELREKLLRACLSFRIDPDVDICSLGHSNHLLITASHKVRTNIIQCYKKWRREV